MVISFDCMFEAFVYVKDVYIFNIYMMCCFCYDMKLKQSARTHMIIMHNILTRKAPVTLL